MDTLKLTDFTVVGEEEKKFCQELQESLEKHPGGVFKPDWKDVSDREDDEPLVDKRDRERKTVTVFEDYYGHYQVYKYAGVLQYQGRTVQLHSRFDDNNQFLSYALEKAGELPVTLLRDMQVSAGVGSYRKLLAYLFLSQLRDAYGLGIYREYRTFEYNDSRPRGYLNISRHIRLNPMNNGRIAYSTREYTADNPVNRLMLVTWQTLRKDPATAETVEKLIQNAPSLQEAPNGIAWEIGEQELNAAATQKLLCDVDRPITHPMHQMYEKVRRTALLILRQQGQELFDNQQQQTTGFLFPMDRVWEVFLEKTILLPPGWKSQNKTDEDKGESQILLSQVGEQDGKPVWSDTGKRKLKPDFLFGDADTGEYTMVLDAKYKKGWAETVVNNASKKATWSNGTRDDVFQVLTYMLITKANIGGIVFPLRDEKTESWKEHPELAEQYMDEIRTKMVYRLHKDNPRQFYTIPVRLPHSGDLETYREELDCRCTYYRKLMEELTTLSKEMK